MVIATSSAPDRIEPALLRSGRIDHAIRVPLPDTRAREEMLRAACARFDTPADFDWAGLASDTAGLTPADLHGVVRRAAYVALAELSAPPPGGAVPLSETTLRECVAEIVLGSATHSDERLTAWGKRVYSAQ
jgi:SpoVK/Ycf46/Vps4 family AAA+-type ATPase